MECAVRPTHLPAVPSNCGWRQQTNAQSVSDRILSARVQSCPVSSSSGISTSRTASCTVHANGRWKRRENRNSAVKAVTSFGAQRLSFALCTSLSPNREEDDRTSFMCRAARLTSHQWRRGNELRIASPKLSHSAVPKLSHNAVPKLSYGGAPKLSDSAAAKLSDVAASKLSYGAAPKMSYGAARKLSDGAARKLSDGALRKLSLGLRVVIGEGGVQSKSSGRGSNERLSGNFSQVLLAVKWGSALQPRLDRCSKLEHSYGAPKARNYDEEEEEEEEYEMEKEEVERERERVERFEPPTGGIYGRPPVEKLFNLKVERPSKERLHELHVSKWSKWESGRSFWAWEWKADELCFIEKGELQITPRDSTRSAVFKAGDLVAFPKWLRARCEVREPLEIRYRFRAIGDAVGIET